MIKAEFIGSSPHPDLCPKRFLPEFAFTGRSNVGKSSLINMVFQRHELARTSSTPGKTTLINHFLIDDAWFLVDLPGYGYASRSVTDRIKFTDLVSDYISSRNNLVMVFLLIDVRHPLQKMDASFMEWLAFKNMPFSIIFTKCDKLGKDTLRKKINEYSLELKDTWSDVPVMLLSSSAKNIGREEILEAVKNGIAEFKLWKESPGGKKREMNMKKSNESKINKEKKR